MADNVTLVLLAHLITEQRDEFRGKFEALETRMDRLEQRMDGVSARQRSAAERSEQDFNQLNDRLDGIAARWDDLRLPVEALERD